MNDIAVGPDTGSYSDAATQTGHSLEAAILDNQSDFNPLWHVFRGATGKRHGIGSLPGIGNSKILLRDVLDTVPKKPMFYTIYSKASKKVKFGISSRNGMRRLQQHGKYWDDAELVAGIEFHGRHSKLPRGVENKIKRHFGTRKEFMSPDQLPSLMSKIRDFSKGTSRENFKAHKDRLRTLRPRDSTGRVRR